MKQVAVAGKLLRTKPNDTSARRPAVPNGINPAPGSPRVPIPSRRAMTMAMVATPKETNARNNLVSSHNVPFPIRVAVSSPA